MNFIRQTIESNDGINFFFKSFRGGITILFFKCPNYNVETFCSLYNLPPPNKSISIVRNILLIAIKKTKMVLIQSPNTYTKKKKKVCMDLLILGSLM